MASLHLAVETFRTPPRQEQAARETSRKALKKIDSAPGTDGFDEAGSGSLPNPLIPCPIRPGRFPMTFDGVGAC